MPRKATIRVRAGIDEAVETERFRKAVAMFYDGFSEQVGAFLESDVLTAVTEHIREAVKKSNDGGDDEEEELEEWEKTKIKQAVEDEIDALDTFVEVATLAAFYIWAFNIGGNDFLKTERIPLTFDLRNERILELIRSKAELLIRNLDATTKKIVAERIIRGIEIGSTKKEIADAIRDLIPETYKSRAETVAYTEASNMINAAESEAAVRNGAVTKRWVTVGDDLVEEECEANEDVGDINVHDQFPSGHVRPPAHPNCRCVLEFETLDLGYYWDGG